MFIAPTAQPDFSSFRSEMSLPQIALLKELISIHASVLYIFRPYGTNLRSLLHERGAKP
jgi:hypothetical protein